MRASYFEEDLFDELLREDFRALPDDFFDPLLLERELDFFADLEPDRDFDDFLVAAIAVILSVPLQKGHGNRVSRRRQETTNRWCASNRKETIGKFIH